MHVEALRGQTCVVTGASSGIGRAIALALACAGGTVCVVARRRRELEVLSEGAERLDTHVADLVVDEELEALASAVLGRPGGVDVLVNSAGTYSAGRLETASAKDLDRQYATNVRAPLLLFIE